MNLVNVITAVCSILFFTIGADKFLMFLEPPCSLMNTVPPLAWQALGVLQIAAGVLLWVPKVRKPVAIFFAIFMCFVTIVHLAMNTYDIGGSAFMAVLLAVLVWRQP